MKQLLQKYADGIDAMALRERVMFFGALALVLMTLLQVFLLNPVLSRRSQLSAQIAQQEDETRVIQAQSQALVRPAAPDQDASNRARLSRLREEMAWLDRQLDERQKQFVAPDKVAAMLEGMVGKNRKLQLLSLRNLPGSGISRGAAPAPGPGGRARAGTAPEVFRHTVEISIKGSYFDLLDYLAALERMPQRVFWDGFELSVAQYPLSVLTLTIYTLSPDRSWLTV